MTDQETTPWGRVDDDGTVFVKVGDTERSVGQYPDATPEEALAYFERKFTDLESQVRLLEQRVATGANAGDVQRTVKSLREQVAGANAVGDLAALERRLEALQEQSSELAREQSAEQQAAQQRAVEEREAIVTEIERLAASDPAKTQWKRMTAEVQELFTRWQAHQHEAPRLPKTTANELWKRFRTARNTIDAHRRAFYASLDSQHKDAKEKKAALVARAEALAPKGADGIPEYRALLDDWKAAGRAGRKLDDDLWARFKAAGDVLFSAKQEIASRENEEYEDNLTGKQALLDANADILEITDRVTARERLTALQRKWEEFGKVPRAAIRTVEDRMRAIEQHVRGLEDEHWEKTNPEKIARAEGMHAQLQDAIAKLERELETARSTGDAKKIAKAEEALESRRAWLGVIEGGGR